MVRHRGKTSITLRTKLIAGIVLVLGVLGGGLVALGVRTQVASDAIQRHHHHLDRLATAARVAGELAKVRYRILEVAAGGHEDSRLATDMARLGEALESLAALEPASARLIRADVEHAWSAAAQAATPGDGKDRHRNALLGHMRHGA